jgi:carboxyl-terminal processing protease
MKKLSLFLLFASCAVFGQTNEKTCELLKKISDMVRREHFKPKPIDDSLSVFVFDSFVDLLDEDHNLFTKTEYDSLCQHRLTLDDDILRRNCLFMDDFVRLYRKSVVRKKHIIEKIQQEKLDFSGKDSIRFSKKAFPFDLNERDLERVWKKRIRFDILEDISKLSDNIDSLKQNFVSLEKAASARIFETNLCKVNSILDSRTGLETELQNDFLNIFCTYFDPHSNYFFLDAKLSFMSALSTSSLSLGVELGMNEKGEITVSEIIPGGPAAQDSQIEKDDIILKVSDKNNREYLVSCTDIETIGEIIFSDANKEIKFTIRKKNGSLVDVALTKQVMKATENSVYSFVAEKNARAGYIRIPSFYSDFEGNSSHGCAEDVANEIVKLTKENIDGLIIDLQDNGGGSMDEAVKLAGMFVDSGPVSVSVNRKKNQTILRDYIPAMIYNGPIVVLINGQSASASEFFTGAMQDYNRALIAGAPSLGKATIQTILPLDDNQEEFLKVTVQKFYRITGESSQIKGIVPDVYLPVIYDSIMPREKSYKTALKYDFIEVNAPFTKYEKDYSKVIAQSMQRVKNSPRFNDISDIDDKINHLYGNPMPALSIRLEDVFAKIREIDILWKRLKAEAEMAADSKILNTSDESRRIKSDKLLGEINEHKMKDARNSPYIEEALNIIFDMKKY